LPTATKATVRGESSNAVWITVTNIIYSLSQVDIKVWVVPELMNVCIQDDSRIVLIILAQGIYKVRKSRTPLLSDFVGVVPTNISIFDIGHR
jgi:hypothetical protein